MKKIRTVLVEDEKKSLLMLQSLLDKYCPEVLVVGTASDVSQAIRVIGSLDPELVFLDISLPDGNAFDMLNRLDKIKFEIIFITAYNEYALKAFKFSALHYILKPISHQDLIDAINRFNKIRPDTRISERVELMNEALNREYRRISINTTEGQNFIDIANILYIEASGNYSIFYLKENNSFVASKPLSFFENILCELNFARIHNAYIANLQYVKKYNKGRGGMITMTNGTELSISASRRKDFLERMEKQVYNF